ncbi:hypothetical protein [Caldalkalibacillus mannanilyticus]|nr:hypothetical protein [Caldalkalibacillus mannanilyticus]
MKSLLALILSFSLFCGVGQPDNILETEKNINTVIMLYNEHGSTG